MLITLNVLSIFRFNFDCTVALFYKSKINIYGVYAARKEKRKDLFTFIRMGDGLMITHMSTVSKKN